MNRTVRRPSGVRSLAAAFALVAVVATACGDADDSAQEEDASAGAATTADAPGDTGQGDAPSETTGDTEPSTSESTMADDEPADGDGAAGDPARAGADVVIEASVAGGEVTVDQPRVPIELGSSVYIEVTADVAEEVHVHGYDIHADVGPDQPAVVELVADVAGLFEVELEGASTLLFEIEVS